MLAAAFSLGEDHDRRLVQKARFYIDVLFPGLE
jgi:hypothetical protein